LFALDVPIQKNIRGSVLLGWEDDRVGALAVGTDGLANSQNHDVSIQTVKVIPDAEDYQ
jgi:hypothetical protein